MDTITNAILSEELGYGCAGICTAIITNGLAETPLIIAGCDELKKKYLCRMIAEPIVAVIFSQFLPNDYGLDPLAINMKKNLCQDRNK